MRSFPLLAAALLALACTDRTPSGITAASADRTPAGVWRSDHGGLVATFVIPPARLGDLATN